MGLLAGACDQDNYSSSRKIKVWIPWDYRSENGRLVGSGAYIQQVEVWGSRMSSIDETRVFGVTRAPKKKRK